MSATVLQFAIVGRNGAYPLRWPSTHAKAMYLQGIRWSVTDMLQVWQAAPSGELLRYDAARTRKLADKIVEARRVQS